MYDLKKIFCAKLLTCNGHDINSVELEEKCVQEVDYYNHYISSQIYPTSPTPHVPTNQRNPFGSYSITFDEDLHIRNETTENISWETMKIKKIDFIQDSLKYFLKEKYSEELFSLFLLKFGL